MPESDFSCVVTTLPDIDSAKAMARRMIESRMAACAKMIRLDSIYWWKEKIEESTEHAVIFTIRTADFDIVRMTILQSHPYDLPMVERYAINDGDPQYLDWIFQSTNVPDINR